MPGSPMVRSRCSTGLSEACSHGRGAGGKGAIRTASARSANLCGCSARRSPRWERRRSEEHTSELQSLMRISYAVLCLKTKHKEQKLTLYNFRHDQHKSKNKSHKNVE